MGFPAQFAKVEFKFSSNVPRTTGNDPVTDIHMTKTESLRVYSMPPRYRVCMA